jgi:iron-sulfur cluster assembly protein
MGGGFRIENPNAVSTCSCGQSFNTQEGAQASGGGGCGCGSH